MTWTRLELATDPYEIDHPGDPAEVYAALVELLDRRPWWHSYAACRGQGVDVFFPTRGQPSDPAKALCASCSVAEDCLKASGEERHGIWGGLSERQRRALRRSPIGESEAA